MRAIPALAILLVLAGCGGGGSSVSTSRGAPFTNPSVSTTYPLNLTTSTGFVARTASLTINPDGTFTLASTDAASFATPPFTGSGTVVAYNGSSTATISGTLQFSANGSWLGDSVSSGTAYTLGGNATAPTSSALTGVLQFLGSTTAFPALSFSGSTAP